MFLERQNTVSDQSVPSHYKKLKIHMEGLSKGL
jgi:hypothetical protein